MSKTPNCRDDEYYNEKYLNEADSEYINGYDSSIDDNIDNFFTNLMNWEDDIKEALFPDPEDEEKVNEAVKMNFETIWNDDMYYSDYQIEDLEAMSPYTRLFLFLKEKMLEWAEGNRNEMITSMLENMDESEYDGLKKKADAGEYKNAIVRHREYKAKYDAGEIPTCWEYKKDENGRIVKIGHCPNGDIVTEYCKDWED